MNHLTTLFRTPFDLSIFPAVAPQRTRRTFAFLLLLVFVATLAATISITLALRDLARKVDPYLDQIPTITIRDGKASADVPQPWVKRLDRDDRGRDIVLIIDTTGQRTDFGPNELGVFVQREQLLLKSDDQRRDISLDKLPDMVVGPSTARAAIAKILRRAPFVVGGVTFVYFFFVKLMQALLLVLVALIGASGRRRALSFGALFTVAVYALTPAILLDCARTFLPVSVPHFWLLYLSLACVYAVLGARRVPDEPTAP